jgi:hypothetical protein
MQAQKKQYLRKNVHNSMSYGRKISFFAIFKSPGFENLEKNFLNFFFNFEALIFYRKRGKKL